MVCIDMFKTMATPMEYGDLTPTLRERHAALMREASELQEELKRDGLDTVAHHILCEQWRKLVSNDNSDFRPEFIIDLITRAGITDEQLQGWIKLMDEWDDWDRAYRRHNRHGNRDDLLWSIIALAYEEYHSGRKRVPICDIIELPQSQAFGATQQNYPVECAVASRNYKKTVSYRYMTLICEKEHRGILRYSRNQTPQFR